LTLLAIAHGRVQPAPQSIAQGFGHYQTLAFKTLHHPVRQGCDAHSGRHHLNQQQGVIHAFQLRADACRLQEVTPDVQTTALHRVDQQRFGCQIFRRDARFRGQGMIRCQHQPHFEIKHRRIVQTAARQNVRGHHQVQLTLHQGRLRIKGHTGFKVHFHLRPLLAEILKRRGQPLNTAVTLNGDTQSGLLRLMAGLQCAGDLRQHLIGQLQQDLPLRCKAQRLALTHEQTEAKALFQIAELVRKGGLRLVQRGRRRRKRTAISQRLERFQVFYLDHESPSLRHEHYALEEYTVPANYRCVNIWTAK